MNPSDDRVSFQHKSTKRDGSKFSARFPQKEFAGEDGKDENKGDIEKNKLSATIDQSTMEGISLEKTPRKKPGRMKSDVRGNKKSMKPARKRKTEKKHKRNQSSARGSMNSESDDSMTSIIPSILKLGKYFTKVSSRDQPSEYRPRIKTPTPIPQVVESKNVQIGRAAAEKLVESALEVCMERFYHEKGPELVALELRNTWHTILEGCLLENIFKFKKGLLATKLTKDDTCLPLNNDIWSKGAIEVLPNSRRPSIMDPFIRDDKSFFYQPEKSTLLNTTFPPSLRRTMMDKNYDHSAESSETSMATIATKISTAAASSVASAMAWTPGDENKPIFGPTSEDEEEEAKRLEQLLQEQTSWKTLFVAPESKLMGTVSDVKAGQQSEGEKKKDVIELKKKCIAKEIDSRNSILLQQQKQGSRNNSVTLGSQSCPLDIADINKPMEKILPRSKSKYELIPLGKKNSMKYDNKLLVSQLHSVTEKRKSKDLNVSFKKSSKTTSSTPETRSKPNVNKTPSLPIDKSRSITKPQKKLWALTSDEMRQVLSRKSEVDIKVVSIFQQESFVETDKSREQILMMNVEKNKSKEKIQQKRSVSQPLKM